MRTINIPEELKLMMEQATEGLSTQEQRSLLDTLADILTRYDNLRSESYDGLVEATERDLLSKAASAPTGADAVQYAQAYAVIHNA